MKRVAVVGAGVSGLTVAYRLRASHQVTLFEREPAAGGHAHTIPVATPDGELGVDVGFIVYNDTTYPGFRGLLDELGVATQDGDMSFGCSCRRCGIAFSSRGLPGLFASAATWRTPSHWLLLDELTRFYRDARRVLALERPPTLTLGDYLRRRGSERAVARHYLVPMVAAIWSMPPDRVQEMPFALLVRFLENHGLIGWRKRLQWRTVTGGSRRYVERLVSRLREGTLCAAAPVEAVRRNAGGVVVWSAGQELAFDTIVLACHADEALRLLADADDAERAALGGFAYSANRVVLHTDERVLPAARFARAAWNVTTADCRNPAPQLTMTYDMNRLQALPGSRRYLVSVNPPALDPAAVLSERVFHHPEMTLRTGQAQERVAAIQGRRATYYAGAQLGYGFHEDGYQSGLRVATLLQAAP
jgi:predicted NAD/FAD-binding protein